MRNSELKHRFYVNGSSVSIAKLSYHINNSLRNMSFPSAEGSDINELIDACKQACYGFDGKLCCDDSVRKAYCMQKNEFNTNLDIYAQSLLKHISETLVTNKELVCERDKLNVYTTGGHFKTHKDSLTNDKMIGTLVICLPSYFEGGEFVLENNETVTLNWSEKSKDHVQWVAFFSDIDHKVCEVTKGERVTISYSISTSEYTRLTECARSSIYTAYNSVSNLIEDLHNKDSSCDNSDSEYSEDTINMDDIPKKSLGYFCEYMYGGVTTDFKNEDLDFYNSAIDSGYLVEVKRVIFYEFEDTDDFQYYIDESEPGELSRKQKKEYTHLDEKKMVVYDADDVTSSRKSHADNGMYKYLEEKYERLSYIKWINTPGGNEKGFTKNFLYGNCPETKERFYRNLCIIVTKPETKPKKRDDSESCKSEMIDSELEELESDSDSE
jgi:hypothetical protein